MECRPSDQAASFAAAGTNRFREEKLSVSAIGEPMAITDEVSHPQPVATGPRLRPPGTADIAHDPAESSGQLSQLLKATSKTREGPTVESDDPRTCRFGSRGIGRNGPVGELWLCPSSPPNPSGQARRWQHENNSACDLYVTYRSEKWSGRLDSNQRPPAPKAGALPGCATPRLCECLRSGVRTAHCIRPPPSCALEARDQRHSAGVIAHASYRVSS